MFNAQVVLDRLREVSPAIDDYLDQEQYRGNHENIYVFDDTMLLNYCLPILLNELGQLGINILFSFEEIITSTELIDACCALREFFDKDAFRQVVLSNIQIKKPIMTLFQSQDVKSKDYLSHLIDLCTEGSIGDRSQLERMLPLSKSLESDSNFVSHITAILDRCYSVSQLTENNIQDYSRFVTEVLTNTLYKLHSRLCSRARNAGCPKQLIPNSAEYIAAWMNLDDVPKHIWLSELRVDDLDEKYHPSATLNRATLVSFHAELNKKQPHNFEYYSTKNVTSPVIMKLILHDAVVNLVERKPTDYLSLRYLLREPGARTNYDAISSLLTPETRKEIDTLLYSILADGE